MLILTRMPGEKVIIKTDNHEIEVILGKVKGRQVSLGFKCSRDVTVHREEIWETIKKEKGELDAAIACTEEGAQ